MTSFSDPFNIVTQCGAKSFASSNEFLQFSKFSTLSPCLFSIRSELRMIEREERRISMTRLSLCTWDNSHLGSIPRVRPNGQTSSEETLYFGISLQNIISTCIYFKFDLISWLHLLEAQAKGSFCSLSNSSSVFARLVIVAVMWSI